MQPFGACLGQLYGINIVSDPLPSPVSCLPRHISDRPSPPPPLIMSLSVDDLVASLSANHIGQEAIDLAALQAHLAQTLLTHQLSLSPPHPHASAFVHGVSVSVVRRDPGNVQHCTTPTARTPSTASCTWPLPAQEHTDHSRRRSSSYARRQSIDDGWYDSEEMAEECTVEDMVTTDSSHFQNSNLWSSHKGDACGSVTRVLSTPSMPLSPSNTSPPPDSSASSLFTSTDPFYLQASQSTQQTHTTFFSHVGMPSSHPPFMMGVVPSWE
ncbi:hypothetical protein L210DRAFT_257981 [Boletus edulis BED1]|uniref:Uncharacterized protein n=1 Tax=Boletus edulis BED1 TaxID=1328754 RepID=A0AAD4C7G5_BOLED|nr:hypothetical protein L210DRAFT_257981 [Boletus edulis BED1]